MDTKFIYMKKDNNEIVYVESRGLTFDCDHYFGRIILKNNCFCGGSFDKYEDVITPLSEKDYNRLIAIDKENEQLGYGITKGDERYQKGLKLKAEFDSIIAKLDNKELFEKCLMENYDNMRAEQDMSDEEFDEIVEQLRSYSMPDASKIGTIYEDKEEFGREEVMCCERIPDWLDNYIDYERFADDTIYNDDRAFVLSTGRVVTLNW